MSRSFIAKVTGNILKLTKPKHMLFKEEAINALSERRLEDKPVKSVFHNFDFNGMSVFTFGNENSDNIILYMHGGAFVYEINWQHYLYCLLLSRKLDAYVIAPAYPLAPLHNAIESFELITELYKKVIKDYNNITLMGDSAGGGFVLSFCQYLKNADLPMPDNLIAFSPWVDLSLSNPPYDNENDPILGEVGLREFGKSWAGNLDIDDYKVSPIHGDNKGFPRTLIFAGTGEIFYRDIRKYVNKLENDDVDVKFIVGEDLFHIYPLFPIPEAWGALKEIEKEIIG